MEHSPEDLPPLENPYIPTFEDLLHRIRTGTLDELYADGAVKVITIGDAPREHSAERYVREDGTEAVSFKQKFNRGFEGWRPGQVVNAQFIVTQKEGKPALLVSDHYVGDIRHADTFILDSIAERDGQDLQKLGIALIDADVEVTSEQEYVASNMFNYSGRISRINGVQPVWRGEGNPRVGEQVLLQGEVVSYEPGETKYKEAEFPVAHIRLANGRVVPIEMTGGSIQYDGGTMDFLHPAGFQVGDVVQLNSYFSNASSWPEHKHRPPTFHASSYRSAFLVQASPDRQRVYDEHRADISRRIGELETLDGQDFRSAYADLMLTYGEQVGEKTTRLLFAPGEWERVRALAEEKFADNPGDMPVLNFGSYLVPAEVNRGYGVDVFGMSRREFYRFCMDVADRKIVADPALQTSTDYPWRIMASEFDAAERFAVLRRAIDYGVKNLSGKESLHRGEELVDPATQTTFDQEYLTEQSIALLPSDLPEAVMYLYETTVAYTRSMLASTDRATLPQYAIDFTTKFFSTIDLAAGAAAKWDRNHGWLGITDPDLLGYLRHKVPEMQEIAAAFLARGERSDDLNVHYILKAIEKIEKLSALPLLSAEPGV